MLLESILRIFIPPLYSLKKKECNFGIPLCVNYWVYERNFCMVIKSKVLAVEWQVILGHFEQNEASISLIKIAGRNRLFSPLRIYSLWDSKMTNFTSINDLNMHSYNF